MLEAIISFTTQFSQSILSRSANHQELKIILTRLELQGIKKKSRIQSATFSKGGVDLFHEEQHISRNYFKLFEKIIDSFPDAYYFLCIINVIFQFSEPLGKGSSRVGTNDWDNPMDYNFEEWNSRATSAFTYGQTWQYLWGMVKY